LRDLTPAQRRIVLARLGSRAASAPEPVPLLPAQFGIWLFEQLEPGTTAYHNPAALRLRGRLPHAVVSAALSALQRRHEALRARVVELGDGTPAQVVDHARDLPLSIVDLRDVPADERETRAHAVAVAAAQQPFDLLAGPLWRACLIRVSDDEHVLVVALHHIVSDGWSLTVLLRELAELCAASPAGGTPRLAPLETSYTELVRRLVDVDPVEHARLVAHWRDTLAGAPHGVPLRRDADPATVTTAGATVSLTLDADVVTALERRCRAGRTSTFCGLFAAFAGMLSAHTSARDLVVMTPVALRDEPGAGALVGCFLNTVPVRLRIAERRSAAALLAEAHRALADALSHSALPLGELVAASDATSAEAISNVMFLHGNATVGATRVGELELERYELPVVASKHDWALLVSLEPQRVTGSFEYRSDRFSRASAERAAADFCAYARALAAGEPAPPR